MNGEPRIGVEVRVTHATDLNAGNNIGLSAYEAFYTSEVGRQFSVSIPIRNPFSSVQNIWVVAPQTDLTLSFTPTAGPFNPFEERTVVMGVDTQSLVPGPTITRQLHLITVAGAPGAPLQPIDDGVSFEINVDA